MALKFSPKYVVDACVVLAYQDPEEPYHSMALAFFKELDKFSQQGKTVEIVIPAHFFVEVNLNIEKKKYEADLGQRKKYEPRQGQEKYNWFGYPVSLEFLKQIEDKGLYEKFGIKLRSGDFIYAALSYIESIPLITLDKDFLRVSSEIEVILLN